MTEGAVTTTERRIQELVAPRLQVRPEQVPLDRPLLDDLGLESIEVVEVVLEIEHTFSPATIADADTTTLTTLRQLAAHIDEQVRCT